MLPSTEWNIIYDKLAKCAAAGAKIVLSRYAIGDLATQYFADRDIFCAGRVRGGLVGGWVGGGQGKGVCGGWFRGGWKTDWLGKFGAGIGAALMAGLFAV